MGPFWKLVVMSPNFFLFTYPVVSLHAMFLIVPFTSGSNSKLTGINSQCECKVQRSSLPSKIISGTGDGKILFVDFNMTIHDTYMYVIKHNY